MGRGKDAKKKEVAAADVVVELKRSQSSIEIKKDAKGVTSFVVKAYADTLEEAETNAIAAYTKLYNLQ